MDQPTQPVPSPPPPPYFQPPPTEPAQEPARAHDPLAIALANASLLSMGYLMMRRRLLAVGSLVVTGGLVLVLCTAGRTEWFEIVLIVWWLAMIVHGWYLAGGRKRTAVGSQWVIAAAITLPVLLIVGLVRLDATSINRNVMDARGSGDCAQVETALNEVWLGHRVIDAPMTARADQTEQACGRLDAATSRFTTALTGDTGALRMAFGDLGVVLVDLPGHERMVDTTLDGFLGGLPARDPCDTVAITDWLRQRPKTGDALDRSVDVVVRTAPTALVECGDANSATNEWETARTYYQQLLDQYPGHELTTRAQAGVTKATQAIELANVRDLLQQPSDAGLPAYCSRPAAYSAAAPYGPGTNRAVFVGDGEFPGRLPAEWRAGDAAEAVLVVCVGEQEHGAPVRTCHYTREGGGGSGNVTFHDIAVPVQAYELRTGNLVFDARVEIGGASCPQSFFSFGAVGSGPPPQWPVEPSDGNVRDAFAPLITR
jgi:hypothetical protein